MSVAALNILHTSLNDMGKEFSRPVIPELWQASEAPRRPGSHPQRSLFHESESKLNFCISNNILGEANTADLKLYPRAKPLDYGMCMFDLTTQHWFSCLGVPSVPTWCCQMRCVSSRWWIWSLSPLWFWVVWPILPVQVWKCKCRILGRGCNMLFATLKLITN